MDKIIINNLKIGFNIGLLPEERKKKRKISIYLEIFLKTKRAAQDEDINHTINYKEVCGLINHISLKKEFNLLETLAHEIAGIVLENFSAGKVLVRVTKKNIYSIKNTESASVEIIRKK